MNKLITTIGYWLIPFRSPFYGQKLYEVYSELFLINGVKLGKYRRYL